MHQDTPHQDTTQPNTTQPTTTTRSSTAPAYYLRRPRSEWMAAIAARRSSRRPAAGQTAGQTTVPQATAGAAATGSQP